MNNNIKGFGLPMGLFTSKTVVDISGKESTYKNPGVRDQFALRISAIRSS